MKSLIFAFVSLLMISCSTPKTNQEYRDGIQRWGKVKTTPISRPVTKVVADVEDFVNKCYYKVTTTVERQGALITQSKTTQRPNWENDVQGQHTLVIRKENARVINQAEGGNYFYLADFKAKSKNETEMISYQMSMGYDFNQDIIATAQGQAVRCQRPGIWDM